MHTNSVRNRKGQTGLSYERTSATISHRHHAPDSEARPNNFTSYLLRQSIASVTVLLILFAISLINRPYFDRLCGETAGESLSGMSVTSVYEYTSNHIQNSEVFHQLFTRDEA